MIKVLFFIPGLSEGGAEKVLRNLVNNMDQTKFDITVQTIEWYDPKLYLADGIHYKSIFHSRTSIGKKLANYWYRFCTELKLTYPLYIKDDYDVEVAYLECGATKVMSASTNKKALKLAWVHCDLKKKGVISEKTGEQYSKFDKVVCVSEDVKKAFDELYGDCAESVVIHNVIDEDEIIAKSKAFKPEWEFAPETKKLIAIGRLAPEKNYSALIDTCAKLRNSGQNIGLYIFGEGPEREKLENQIAALNLNERVKLKGFTDNPYLWIASADYVVCSSLYEGISTVAQEALILGKIFVTTPCGGMKEVLGDSEYGLIAENSEDGLYKVLSLLLNDSDAEKKYSSAAMEKSRMMKKKRVVAQTESLFEII